MAAPDLNFVEFSQRNPCADCPAPCCQLQLIPHRRPTTFMDTDFLHYMLLFPHTEVVVTLTDNWSIVKWEDCRAFEASKHMCKLHNTPAKPRTCSTYNPYNCWYKRSFVLNDSREVYRLDLERFEVWVNEIQFAEDGKSISMPNFERSLDIVKGMPIAPHIGLLSGNASASDPRLPAANQQSENNNRRQMPIGGKESF